jgi:hypothetical protein
MLVAEQFIKGLVKKYGKHPFIHSFIHFLLMAVETYPQACNFLKLINASITSSISEKYHYRKNNSVYQG